MTQLRTALRAYLFEGHDPAACLDRLDLLMDGLLDQRVATAVVAVLDPATGAGPDRQRRPPAAAAGPRRRGRARSTSSRDRCSASGAGSRRRPSSSSSRGSTLLVYTDGLVEERGVDMRERMARPARAGGRTHPGRTLDAWVDGLLAVQGPEPDDDTTSSRCGCA